MAEISIIVPVYNVEKYLKRCIDSILKQTFTDYEVILVDDGSNDKSCEICDKYAEEHSNFKVIHKKNEGLGLARNSGLEVVQGSYVTFLDSDDYYETRHLDNMYRCLKNNNADTCFSGYKKIYNNREVEFFHVCKGQVFANEEIIHNVLSKMCGKKSDGTDYIEMSVCMVLLSNNIIKSNNLKFASERKFISEDLIFDFDYYPLSKKLCVSEDVGYCYCDNEGSLTTKYRSDRFEAQKVMYLEVEKQIKKYGIEKKSASRNMTTFIAIARYCIKQEIEFRGQNGNKTAFSNIKKICNDNLLITVMKNYDNKLVPMKSRVINILIKKKKIRTLWIIEWLREYLSK